MNIDPSIKLAEYLNDQRWRLNSLYWIQGLDSHGAIKKIKFRMNEVQTKFFEQQWWRSTILKSRQHGISTLIAILQLDQALFNDTQICGIIDKTDDDATKKLAKVKYAYDHLDDPDGSNTASLGAAIKEAIPMDANNAHGIMFRNNSEFWAGTNFRGGTFSYLWITELGYIAHFFPKKASELKSGTLNTVHQGSKIVIESTHEGGKTGLNYEIIKIAQQSPPDEEMTSLDWQFHFYGWHEDPKNSLELPLSGQLHLSDEQNKYFNELLINSDIDLTREQKHWYVKTELIQKGDMKKEHPSTAEEALDATIRGSIYGKEITALRKAKHIIDFAHDRAYPLWTFWDLGQTDYTSIVLIQFTGREYSILNSFAWHGEDYTFYIAKLEEWEREYGFISGDYIPHDGEQAGKAMKDSWFTCLKKGGRKNVKVVPRTPDLWIGIKHLRSLLPRCWIHATACGVEREIGFGNDAEIIPSLLACLEGYHTKPTESGARIMELPVHDHTSHSCDALRTFSEAHARGMLEGATSMERDSRRGGRGVKVIHEPMNGERNSSTQRKRLPNVRVNRL